MIPEEPVTEWLHGLPAGDSLAQHHVLRVFAKRLESIANRYLGAVQKRDSDGEDVAINVFNSLFQRVEDGRLDVPANRKELGGLLVAMARIKSAEAVRRKLAAKRGQGKVFGESGFAHRYPVQGIDGVAADSANPKQAYENSQTFRELLDSMRDDQVRNIALLRMSGHSVAEIAATLVCSKSTVERRIQELKKLLEGRNSASDASTRR